MSRSRSLEVIEKAEYVTISELVRLSGVRYSTIKYYTEEGMIPYKQEDTGLVRRYHRVTALFRLNEINNLKQDMTIEEVKQTLLEAHKSQNHIS